jgi:hypothetical protein
MATPARKSESQWLLDLTTDAAALKGGSTEVGFQFLCDAAKVAFPFLIMEQGCKGGLGARGWTEVAMGYSDQRAAGHRSYARLYRGMKDLSVAYVQACLAWGVRQGRCTVDQSPHNAEVTAYTVFTAFVDEESAVESLPEPVPEVPETAGPLVPEGDELEPECEESPIPSLKQRATTPWRVIG